MTQIDYFHQVLSITSLLRGTCNMRLLLSASRVEQNIGHAHCRACTSDEQPLRSLRSRSFCFETSLDSDVTPRATSHIRLFAICCPHICHIVPFRGRMRHWSYFVLVDCCAQMILWPNIAVLCVRSQGKLSCASNSTRAVVRRLLVKSV
jgi:hypothetical protein